MSNLRMGDLESQHYFMDLSMPKVRPLQEDLTDRGFFSNLWFMTTYKRRWKLEEDFFIYIPWLQRTFMVPEGFITDFASVPRAMWPILSPTGFLMLGSLPHDLGFRYGGLIEHIPGIGFVFEKWTRSELDCLLTDITKVVSKSSIPGGLAGAGLTIGSWVAWNRYRKENANPYADYPYLLATPQCL